MCQTGNIVVTVEGEDLALAVLESQVGKGLYVMWWTKSLNMIHHGDYGPYRARAIKSCDFYIAEEAEINELVAKWEADSGCKFGMDIEPLGEGFRSVEPPPESDVAVYKNIGVVSNPYLGGLL